MLSGELPRGSFFINRVDGPVKKCDVRLFSELKTEEGYSADIVRTYMPGDICPHNVRTTSHEGYMSHERDVVRT